METIAIPAAAALLLVIERIAGRHAANRGWLLRNLPWLALAAVAYALIPSWLADHAGSSVALDRRIGDVPAGIAAFVLADLIGYVTHRLRHTLPALWRWHQLHHSAERVDTAGSALFHPIDLAIELAAIAGVVIVLGLERDAAAIASVLTWSASLLQHADLATPRWLGWVIQRPEAHAVHHARGIHAYNYGRLMVWDIVLGTFRNPTRFPSEPAGFWDGASTELTALLAGRDVGHHSRKDRR